MYSVIESRLRKIVEACVAAVTAESYSEPHVMHLFAMARSEVGSCVTLSVEEEDTPNSNDY